MRKPKFELFLKFKKIFEEISKEAGLKQYIVPYFISNFPASTPEKMNKISKWLQKEKWNLQQVQSFIPLPMTMASTIYYTGINPYTKENIHIPKVCSEKKLQQALLQPHIKKK